MNIILLGKVDKNGVHVVEREDDDGYLWPIKYGDWDGMGLVAWYHFEGGVFEQHYFNGHAPQLTDYPLIPVEYAGKYALVLAVNDYELDTYEQLTKVGPVAPKVVKTTIQEMWS